MNLLISFRFILICIFGVFLTISCVQKKTKVVEEELSVKNSTPVIESNKDVLINATLEKNRDSRKTPVDSIKKWNAEFMHEREKLKIKIDSKTQNFSINTKTGEVVGCPLLKFLGEDDDNYWASKKEKRKLLGADFKSVKPNIRSALMQGKKGELWYGDPKNIEIAGTPEAAHSGRGPIGFLYTDNRSHLIVPSGFPHGGMIDELFFFDSDGVFISKTALDRPLNVPSVEFNAAQTFVTVSDGVNGDFYFFKIDGSLERKGNFNEITKDRGTSYGKPVISETGEFWLLKNNFGYLFKNDSLVTKISGYKFFIDEHRKLLYYGIDGKLVITDIENKEMKYQLIQKDIYFLNVQGRKIRLQNLENKKKYTYEII